MPLWERPPLWRRGAPRDEGGPREVPRSYGSPRELRPREILRITKTSQDSNEGCLPGLLDRDLVLGFCYRLRGFRLDFDFDFALAGFRFELA